MGYKYPFAAGDVIALVDPDGSVHNPMVAIRCSRDRVVAVLLRNGETDTFSLGALRRVISSFGGIVGVECR